MKNQHNSDGRRGPLDLPRAKLAFGARGEVTCHTRPLGHPYMSVGGITSRAPPPKSEHATELELVRSRVRWNQIQASLVYNHQSMSGVYVSNLRRTSRKSH